MISFRHEQNAGYAASIAGFMTGKPGICLTVSAPGFLNGLTALANATTNCFPMILISGSSEREIVDLQQGDYEEMDQLAIARPHAKAAFRVLHAEDIGVGVARAIRAAVSGRPGGVYLDLPAKLFPQTIDAEAGRQSLIKVVDPAPRQIPAPDAVQRALDLLRSAKRPLIILGKGAAYAQADADIRALVEKTGIPYLPMSMAKGLLPDTHEQWPRAARSYVLPEADVVMLIGARLNWLLSQGKGKTWGGKSAKEWGGQKFVQIDISPQEADSNVRIDAPVVGDIGSCVSAMLGAHGFELAEAARRVARRDRGAQDQERREDGRVAREESDTDELPQRAQRRARHRQGESGRHPRKRGRERARLHAQHRRHVQAAQAPRRRHVGRDGHRHGLCGRAAVVSGEQVIAVEGDSAFGFSGMECETICRYNLPVCVVIMNNNGVYRGDEVNPDRRTRSIALVFVKGARYEKLMEAFGGVGVMPRRRPSFATRWKKRSARASRR